MVEQAQQPASAADAGSSPSPVQSHESPQRRHRRHRTLLIAVIVVLVLIVLVWAWYEIFRAGRVSTDDAYTDGRAVTVAPEVSGRVVQLAVTDNQAVRAGQLLLQIDPRGYRDALDAADAQLERVRTQLQVAQLNLQIAHVAQPAQLAGAIAQRDAALAAEQRALADFRRYQRVDPLATSRTVTDRAREAASASTMQVREAEARLKTARLVPQNLQLAAYQVRELQAQLAAAQAQRRRAALNLGYTRVLAPQAGRVTMRTVERGDFVQPGEGLLVLVTPQVWVTANFKETDLAHMRVGQPVTISVDAFPGLTLHGHVDSFQMGTGERFSAFPAENATGNFVKIVQRLPVKIVIDRGIPAGRMLPFGLSVEPTVDERR